MKAGFHQIVMDEDSKKYTGFSTSEGHFEYERIPFGLKNAPATFQRMMDQCLVGLNHKIYWVCMYDIVIFGETIEEHNQNLVTVFERLRKCGLTLEPEKCKYLLPEVENMGHIITADGVQPNPAKIEAVRDFPVPTNPTEVKSFVGLAGYYRRFINNFSHTARPMVDLMKEDVIFEWTDKCQKAFKDLKTCLAT